MSITFNKINSAIINDPSLIIDVTDDYQTFLNYVLTKKHDFDTIDDYYLSIKTILEKLQDIQYLPLLVLDNKYNENTLSYLIKYYCFTEKASNIIGKDLLINITSNIINYYQEKYNDSYINIVSKHYNKFNSTEFIDAFNFIDDIFLNIIENNNFPTILNSKISTQNILDNKKLYQLNIINKLIINSINYFNFNNPIESDNLIRYIIISNNKCLNDKITNDTKDFMINNAPINYPNKSTIYPDNYLSYLSNCYLDLHFSRLVEEQPFFDNEQMKKLLIKDLKFLINNKPKELSKFIHKLIYIHYNNILYNIDDKTHNKVYQITLSNILEIFNKNEFKNYQNYLISTLENIFNITNNFDKDKINSHIINLMSKEQNYLFNIIYENNNDISSESKIKISNDELALQYKAYEEKILLQKDNLNLLEQELSLSSSSIKNIFKI